MIIKELYIDSFSFTPNNPQDKDEIGLCNGFNNDIKKAIFIGKSVRFELEDQGFHSTYYSTSKHFHITTKFLQYVNDVHNTQKLIENNFKITIRNLV